MYSVFHKTVARFTSAAVSLALAASPFMALMPATAYAAEGVTTEAATSVSQTDATLNATNNDVAATNSSFWVSTSTINTSSPSMPAGVYSTQVLGPVAANGTQNVQLSAVATSGIPGNLPGGIQPATTYYYVAWVEVGGNWYPGNEETVTTDAPPDTTAPDAPVISYPLDATTYTSVAMVDWNDITDPSSPVTYLYEASMSPATELDGSFTSPVYESGVLTDSGIPTPGTPNGTYSVHAKAVDSEGNESDWGPTVTFTIDSNAAPVIPACGVMDSTTFDGFALGNVNGQGGWQSTGPFDQEVVDNIYGYPTFGCKSLRISNAVTSGSFGDQTFSYSTANEAGETAAVANGMSGGVRQTRFEAQFDLASTKPNAQQADLRLSVSPDRGDGARMSYLRFEDQADGIHVFFDDVTNAGPLPSSSSFNEEDIKTLDRSVPHTIKFVMDFVDGAGNDIVEIYIDGVLEHTGTSWENYYRFDSEQTGGGNLVPTTDSLIFRASGGAAAGNDEEGFLFDNVELESSMIPTEPIETSTVTMCKYADTYPDQTPLPGWTLTLTGAHLEDIVVPANTSSGINSVNPLAVGTSYIATAVGTWLNGGANAVDAEYSSTTTPPWTTYMDGYDGYSTDILELQINQAFDPDSDWGTYNSGHTYAQSFTQAVAGPANFRIFDGSGTTQNEDWFPDNNGTLAVSLDEGYAGITGENGCVTFENVPYGDYEVGEIMQDGWVNESGLGSVEVDDETETFEVVNHNDEFGNDSCVLVSDATTLQGGQPSDLVPEPHHESWTAVIDALAVWIWGDVAVDDPTEEETQTFTKTFWLETVPVMDATLVIAADNSYEVELNGSPVDADANEDNYTDAEKDTITIPAGDFVLGANTLVFTVKNLAMGGGTQATNPAGLNYKLTIPGAECDLDPQQDTVQVHIYKYLEDTEGDIALAGAGDSTFPMTATWAANNIGAGSGSYSLSEGNGFTTSTSEMTVNADYTTSEVTDGSVVVPSDSNTCPAGKYRLVGYKTGDTLVEAENDATTTFAPNFLSMDVDKYVIVVNEDCDELDEPANEQVHVHIYKYLTDDESEDGISQVPSDANIFPFEMTATWKTANLNGGATTTGEYVLGNNHGGTVLKYAADTSPMDVPANYTTSELTGENGIIPIGGACVDNTYRLVGYKTGADLAAALAAETTDDAPVFYGLEDDQTVIVINEDCNEVEGPGTLTIIKETVGGDGTFYFTADSENENIEDATHFSLTTTEENGHTDSESIELPAGDYEVSEEVPPGWTVDIECVYEEESVGTSNSPSSESITLEADETVTCTFTNTLSEVEGEHHTILATVVGDGTITPSGSVIVADGDSQAFVIDAGSGQEIVAVNVDGVDQGTTGLYTFTNVTEDHTIEAVFDSQLDGNGGNGSSGGSSGSVLGAATDEPSNACVPLLNTYMRLGMNNNAQEVMDLKGFLNDEMDLTLAVNSLFDEATDAAVRAFQNKYKSEVLDPWKPFGFNDQPTGYVFKLTQWKVNSIHCAPTVYPFPKLP